jgi:hypothetical protein
MYKDTSISNSSNLIFMKFSFSTYFPTTPSKADWRSLAGRVS